MHKILMINEEKVALGDENNNLVTVPRTAISYENPAVGDSVDLFRNDSVSIIKEFRKCSRTDGVG